jgi:hypothetical protein
MECNVGFVIERDLMRFDRTDEDTLGILVPPEEAATRRLKALNEAIKNIVDRLGRVEELLLDDRDDGDDKFMLDS